MTDSRAPEVEWQALRRARRAIVVVDVVESVRLMQQHEDDVIDRWRRFVTEVSMSTLAPFDARLVKSLGDGLLLELADSRRAVELATTLHQRIAPLNAGRSAAQALLLRIGIHVADVVVDALDIYGSGVNLAARLATLAGPGETVVSEALADALVAGLDAELDDLGPCYFKHIEAPVRAFRVRGPAQRGAAALAHAVPLVPVIAVLPLSGSHLAPGHEAIGHAIADNLIDRLSTSANLRVISRLSSAALASRPHSVAEIGALLGCSYVLSGTYWLTGPRVFTVTELADARSQQVVWTERDSMPLAEVLGAQNEHAEQLCRRVVEAISLSELRRLRTQPLPTLEAFSLQLAGMSLMHKASRRDFDQAGAVLEHLIERHPRAPEPRAWLAKWYVLRVTRGHVQTPADEAALALDHTHRALDSSPDCSLALAAEGFVHCHMLRDLDAADLCLDQALVVNPNESLAWLFKCSVQTFRGLGDEALASAERAVALSPLDPMRHYFDGLASSAAVAAGQLGRAIELATRSLRVTRDHLPTLRALAIAQAESGLAAAAQATAQRILQVDPQFTIRRYLERGPQGGEAARRRFATALQEAGIPAG